MLMAKSKKRAKKYEPKVDLKDDVTFDALISVGLNYDPKKVEKKKKPKKHEKGRGT